MNPFEWGLTILAAGALMIVIEDSVRALIRFWDFDGYNENVEPVKRWLSHATFIAGLVVSVVGAAYQLVIVATR